MKLPKLLYKIYLEIYKRHLEAEIEDIDKNLEILKKKNLDAKIHSFLTAPYLLFNVDKHIEFLEKRKAELERELRELKRWEYESRS